MDDLVKMGRTKALIARREAIHSLDCHQSFMAAASRRQGYER